MQQVEIFRYQVEQTTGEGLLPLKRRRLGSELQ